MSKVDDAYKQAQFDAFDKNELLMRALEKAALKGKIRPDAIELVHNIYCDKCKIIDGEITLGNLPLDEGVDAIIQRMPLVQPPKDDPHKAEAERLEQEALQGSVSAHGAMYRRFLAESGNNARLADARYREWCDQNRAAPGKKADGTGKPIGDLDADDLKRVGQSTTNPWSPEGWSLTRQGAVFKADPSLAERLSRAAGSYIGATKPSKVA